MLQFANVYISQFFETKKMSCIQGYITRLSAKFLWKWWNQ